MKTYLAIFVLSAVATYLLTPLAARLALLWGAVDLPGERKIHTRPMPRLGGLAVYAGFCLPWIGFYLFKNRVTNTFHQDEKLFLTFLAGATAMLGMGIYDDIKGANASKKFAAQTIIAVGLYAAGFRITLISNPFGPALHLGGWALPVSVLWIVGITNAMNLLDGIDGLASGVTACIALSLAVINGLANNVVVTLLTLCLAGACFGFLPHNFSPARIFLGDSGSLFIGLALACIGMISLFKAATATFVAVPVILFALPLLDTTSVVLGRAWRGRPIFQADKTHIHHQLLRMGFNQRQAATLLCAVAAALGGLAILVSLQRSPQTMFGIATLVFFLAVMTWWAWHKQIRGRSHRNQDPDAGT